MCLAQQLRAACRAHLSLGARSPPPPSLRANCGRGPSCHRGARACSSSRDESPVCQSRRASGGSTRAPSSLTGGKQHQRAREKLFIGALSLATRKKCCATNLRGGSVLLLLVSLWRALTKVPSGDDALRPLRVESCELSCVSQCVSKRSRSRSPLARKSLLGHGTALGAGLRPSAHRQQECPAVLHDAVHVQSAGLQSQPCSRTAWCWRRRPCCAPWHPCRQATQHRAAPKQHVLHAGHCLEPPSSRRPTAAAHAAVAGARNVRRPRKRDPRAHITQQPQSCYRKGATGRCGRSTLTSETPGTPVAPCGCVCWLARLSNSL